MFAKLTGLKSVVTVSLAVSLLLFCACQTTQKPQTATGGSSIAEKKSSAVKIAAPAYTESDLNQLVRDNNNFAFDLYNEVKDEAVNVFFSPYSLSTALAMTYAGAKNRTETQMAAALHFNFPQDKLHMLFNALDYELAGRKQNDSTSGEKYLKLKNVNAVWAQVNYTFLDKFLDTLMINYGSGVQLVNFASNPEQARLDINNWVANQTENKILDFLASDDVDRLTVLVLTNAMYFNGAWAIPFDPVATDNGSFYLADGSSVTAFMMVPKTSRGEAYDERFAVASGAGYQVVDVPYYGGEFSMLIIMPSQGTFTAFERDLNYPLIEEIVGNLDDRNIRLKMPKFDSKFNIRLADKLSAMGMPDAFISGVADFTGMDGGARPLAIGNVIHQAKITVNEAGTEAAAATAVGMTYTSMPEELVINRPFIYMIRDIKTGAILFLGRVKNPNAD